MSRTILEEIIAAHSSEGVNRGAMVWLGLDGRAARDFLIE